MHLPWVIPSPHPHILLIPRVIRDTHTRTCTCTPLPWCLGACEASKITTALTLACCPVGMGRVWGGTRHPPSPTPPGLGLGVTRRKVQSSSRRSACSRSASRTRALLSSASFCTLPSMRPRLLRASSRSSASAAFSSPRRNSCSFSNSCWICSSSRAASTYSGEARTALWDRSHQRDPSL